VAVRAVAAVQAVRAHRPVVGSTIWMTIFRSDSERIVRRSFKGGPGFLVQIDDLDGDSGPFVFVRLWQLRFGGFPTFGLGETLQWATLFLSRK
jgi:hypothetical protein